LKLELYELDGCFSYVSTPTACRQLVSHTHSILALLAKASPITYTCATLTECLFICAALKPVVPAAAAVAPAAPLPQPAPALTVVHAPVPVNVSTRMSCMRVAMLKCDGMKA
jgi:hypothetical protein